MLRSIQVPASKELSGRLIAIRAKRGTQYFWFCACYVPPLLKEMSFIASRCFGQVSTWLASVPARTTPVVMGDMNARTGWVQQAGRKRLSSEISNSIGPHEPEVETEQGCVFRRMLETYNMVAVNTKMQQGAKTYCDKGAGVSRIDYICVSQRFWEQGKITYCRPQVEDGWDLSNFDTALLKDHVPIVMNLPNPPKVWDTVEIRQHQVVC